MSWHHKRGICPECGVSVCLYMTGTIRQHTPNAPGIRHDDDPLVLCPGSGKLPAEQSA